MKHLHLGVFAWLALALSIAPAAPARLPYEPAPRVEPVLIDLRNTTWIGMLYHENSKITFHPDGTLTYGEPGGGSPGLWKLTGDKLYFEINQYSEYQATVQGDVIRGKGVNKAGQACSPNLKRVGAPTLGPVP